MSAGIVETKVFTLCRDPTLDSGTSLGPITLAYETYGAAKSDKSNAILIEHAFSGDAHAAGFIRERKARLVGR